MRFAPEAEVLVVDNASTDQTVGIAMNGGFCRVLQNTRNTGFGAACNRGAAEATRPVLMFLNQDAVLAGPIDPAVNRLCEDSAEGVLGALVKYGDGRVQASLGREPSAFRILLNWIGYPLRILGLAKSSELLLRAPALYQAPTAADWVAGSSLFVTAKLFQELGGFSSRYFMYVEDADLCKRARVRGYGARLCPEVEVVHSERGGAIGISSVALRYTLRGQATYVTRFSSALLARLVMLVLAPLFAVFSIALCVAGAVLRSEHAATNGKAFCSGASEAFGIALKGLRDMEEAK